MANVLQMRPAREEEAARVAEILEDGKRTIAQFGIEQWQRGYPNIESVRADIATGSCYVAEDPSGALVGTLALLGGIDPEYCRAQVPWLTPNPFEGEEDAPYLAIHRSATAAEALGSGVMGFMFDAAEAIARERGARSIRIDTHPGNRAMRSFLAKQGFTELKAFDLTQKDDTETDLTRIAYEKLV